MASERSSTDSILVSAMKQNVELKAALSILMRENEDLETVVFFTMSFRDNAEALHSDAQSKRTEDYRSLYSAKPGLVPDCDRSQRFRAKASHRHLHCSGYIQGCCGRPSGEKRLSSESADTTDGPPCPFRLQDLAVSGPGPAQPRVEAASIPLRMLRVQRRIVPRLDARGHIDARLLSSTLSRSSFMRFRTCISTSLPTSYHPQTFNATSRFVSTRVGRCFCMPTDSSSLRRRRPPGSTGLFQSRALRGLSPRTRAVISVPSARETQTPPRPFDRRRVFGPPKTRVTSRIPDADERLDTTHQHREARNLLPYLAVAVGCKRFCGFSAFYVGSNDRGLPTAETVPPAPTMDLLGSEPQPHSAAFDVGTLKASPLCGRRDYIVPGSRNAIVDPCSTLPLISLPPSTPGYAATVCNGADCPRSSTTICGNAWMCCCCTHLTPSPPRRVLPHASTHSPPDARAIRALGGEAAMRRFKRRLPAHPPTPLSAKSKPQLDGSDTLSVSLDVAKNILEIAQNGSAVCPPLQTAAGLIVSIYKVVERTGDARSRADWLGQRALDLLHTIMLVSGASGAEPQEMHLDAANIKELEDVLRDILETLQQISRRKFLPRVLHVSKDEKALDMFDKKLDRVRDKFMLCMLLQQQQRLQRSTPFSDANTELIKEQATLIEDLRARNRVLVLFATSFFLDWPHVHWTMFPSTFLMKVNEFAGAADDLGNGGLLALANIVQVRM
uniref:Uncharacterized protein n=1 Tax=Mycena chlorophos TaxID=658473 RepID=A0ABQ0L274_MYCCL|nr:predicted protein [Mycena chlorophos]